MVGRQALWALAVGSLCVASSAPAQSIEPTPVVQSLIASAAAANSETEFQRVIDELKGRAPAGYSDLIPQLVYAVANAKDRREETVPTVIIRRLQISKEELRSALQPYRNTPDPRLKIEIENLLSE